MRYTLLALMLLCAPIVVAQEIIQENNEYWSGFTLKTELNKKFTLNLDHQVRFNNNMRNIRVAFFEGGVKYKITKWLSSKAQLRYSIRPAYRNTTRLSLDFIAKQNLPKQTHLKLSYRLRYQHTTVSFTGQPFDYLRARIMAKHQTFKHIKTHLSAETFFRFNERNEIRGNRFAVGLEWSITKQLSLDIFYAYDQEVNVKSPLNRSIIGTLLTVEF